MYNSKKFLKCFKYNGENNTGQTKKKNNLFNSNNMFYIFYTEYFDKVKEAKLKNLEIESISEAVYHFKFNPSFSPLKEWKSIPNYTSVCLKTLYPGLVVGSGYPHVLEGKNIIKSGLSLDYVSGLPYIPGSSLKGLLRSCFPENDKDLKIDYLNDILEKKYDYEIWSEICHSIFDNRDVFLGGVPKFEKPQCLLTKDYITPHLSSFENPKPIEIIKVKPSVKFEFGFLLKDSQLSTGEIVMVSDKLKLFKAIILDFGMGAKTNVGFGQFSER